ncbi:putative tRNA(Ile)-lysidine synthase [Fusarium austroafricanum]|uniref:tRNA(Ile)-lysidine synthetase n=1 Tax=Fusarium austroafricanum TaxID=2364996 RepID=A0A8H4KJM8_9HYPO|nr:putative tRNA(Ile)-lysidine synthase [Fusarium austroafricanum]
MTTAARVFHHAPRPISVTEFKDAIDVVCRSRFPTARFARPRRIVLAISGGVDSMALAWLMSKLVRQFRNMKIADNPVHGILALVVDHKLRDGSGQEAAEVVKQLRQLDIKASVSALTWKDEKRQGLDPRQLPNVEGLARTHRYRLLGRYCAYHGSDSLFFAHHQDDQYETVLMRLLGGHGYRGLQGIREANSIPECYDLHGVYKSGLLDDQLSAAPALSFRPALREMRRLRRRIQDELALEQPSLLADFPQYLVDSYPGSDNLNELPDVPYLKPLEVEDGGVMIYRPLLEFDKDRLIATCEANKVPWVEDATNKDPTLTTRNAIRYLVRNHELPKALQKPSILSLAKRSKQRTKFEEAEASRYLIREAVVKDFDPNAGTLLAQFPTPRQFNRRYKRRSLHPKNELRKEHRKIIMSIAVRKLIDFVTPEYHLPPLSNLEKVVNGLVPGMAPQTNAPPKAFTTAGVYFDPIVRGNSIKWLLSRAPYTSNKPLPTAKLYLPPSYLPPSPKYPEEENNDAAPSFNHSGWMRSKMFDGRFWTRIGRNKWPKWQFHPYRAEYAKAFRKALPPMRRARLEKLLKHYAPGKIRYTLPAIYGVERERDPYSLHITTTLTLLALPTLGIHLPGLERSATLTREWA